MALRVLFMGTPEFAAVQLRALWEQKEALDLSVVGAVCQPDKPRGRGKQLLPCAVKAYAQSVGIPVFQPQTLRDEAFAALLRECDPELIVVAAYGKLLPESVLQYPRLGCINVHGSLLPHYRGAAPIQRAVMNGDTVTGLTTMYLSQGMDEGDMILKTETDIGATETTGELTERLAHLGAPLLAETIDRIAEGTAVRIPQDPAAATYATMLDKSEGHLDFTRPANALYCVYRALTPALSVSTTFRGKSVKITEMRLNGEETCGGTPGEVVRCTKDGISVCCGDGRLLTFEGLAPEGKRAMTAADFINGRAVKPGDRFGEPAGEKNAAAQAPSCN